MNTLCTALLISYNHSKYIKKAIESVLEQKTDYNYIIKIFDDASSDGTQEIIKEYANKYPDKIIPYLNTQNIGAQENIWNAYKSVDTKYCILLECDDYWCDNKKLQMQIEALEQHPECSFCGHNTLIKTLDENSREYPDIPILTAEILKKKRIFDYDDFYPITSGGYIPYQSARLLRSECLQLDKINYKEAVLFDFCQFYYFLIQGKYYYINSIMSVYQRTGNGECSSKSPMEFLNIFVQNCIDFNKQTNFKIADKIFSDCNLQINHRLNLQNFYIKKNNFKNNKKNLLSKFWNAVYKKPIKFVKTKIMRK